MALQNLTGRGSWRVLTQSCRIEGCGQQKRPVSSQKIEVLSARALWRWGASGPRLLQHRVCVCVCVLWKWGFGKGFFCAEINLMEKEGGVKEMGKVFLRKGRRICTEMARVLRNWRRIFTEMEKVFYGNGNGFYGNGDGCYGNGPGIYGNGEGLLRKWRRISWELQCLSLPRIYGNGPGGYGNGRPRYGNGRPIYGNGRPSYGNGRPIYGNGRPILRKWWAKLRKWAASYGNGAGFMEVGVCLRHWAADWRTGYRLAGMDGRFRQGRQVAELGGRLRDIMEMGPVVVIKDSRGGLLLWMGQILRLWMIDWVSLI